MALSVSACFEPKIYCETFDYAGNHVVLAVPSAYYFLPRSADSGIALRFRYQDLAAVKGAHKGFDWEELSRPGWTVASSNYDALLEIERHSIVKPQRLENFKPGHPKLREVSSDWEGWTKLELCPSNCSERIYLNEEWRTAGLSYVGCYEVDWRDPKYIPCAARDNINGLHVTYYFPVVQKSHFSEFRAKVVELTEKWAEDAKSACTAD